jgi:GGDEF domain-containing protein
VSIGLAQLDDSITTADSFVRAADERLYASKRTGKNRYTF